MSPAILSPQSSAMGDVLDAVYAALSPQNLLPEEAVVVDGAGEGQLFPYVTFAEGAREDPNDTIGTAGRTVTFILETWVREGGYRQAARIIKVIVKTITAGLDVAGWQVEDIEYRGSGPQTRLTDAIVRHVPTTFRISLTELS